MNANELMVGDYLRVNKDNICIPKGTIVRVTEIDSENALREKGLKGSAHCESVEDTYLSGGVWCDYLEPVPLTAEILEKNGFVKNRGVTSWKFETEREDLIDICGVNEYHLSINIEDTHGSGKGYRWMLNNLVIFYVHQLQHALRLCGIEKEIEL